MSNEKAKTVYQKKENFKQFNIRNLKVLGSTCNFVAPFVISFGISVGAFKVFGGGLPFHLDEMTKYKAYNLELETNGCLSMDEEYITNRWFESPLPENHLIVYTPWVEQNDQCVRFKREYNLEKIATLDLYNSFLNADYNIFENLKDYKEEKQITYDLEVEKNNYVVEVSLHLLDKEDVLKYNETELKNILITIIELALGLGIGGAISIFRNFDFLDEIGTINDIYHYNISLIESMKQEPQETKSKILSLTKSEGDKNNER